MGSMRGRAGTRGLTSQTAQPTPARTQISTKTQRDKSCSRRCLSRGRECRGVSSKGYVLSLAKSAGLLSSRYGTKPAEELSSVARTEVAVLTPISHAEWDV